MGCFDYVVYHLGNANNIKGSNILKNYTYKNSFYPFKDSDSFSILKKKYYI